MRTCSYVRQMIQVLLILTLTSTIGVRCYSINDSEPGQRDTLKGSRIGRLVCPLLYCRGLTGNKLHICYQERCSGDPSGQDMLQDSATFRCAREKCGENSQFLRDACIYWKCGGLEEANSQRRKKWSENIMWPDEFETRSVDFWPDDFETRSVPMESDALEDDRMAGSKIGRSKRDMEQGRPVNSQGCSGQCHGYTGKKYTTCIALACPKHPSSSHVASVQKRWSTRLCMGAHCQGLASKVDYFLCGKQKCHK